MMIPGIVLLIPRFIIYRILAMITYSGLILPKMLIFLFFQRYFNEGISYSGLKG